MGQRWPQLDPGTLRHRITIQSQQVVSDASGTGTGWVDFVQARAAINPVRGTDVLRSGQDTTQLFVTISIYWQEGILPNMQVVSDSGSTFVIQSIENVRELNIVLLLNCLEIGNNQ